MCDIADDGPSAWYETWRRARKPHKCCACGELIAAGDRYHYASGVWDGQGASFKHCARCWRLFRRLSDGSSEPIVLTLDCGDEYEGDDLEMLELAFVTAAEAQERFTTTFTVRAGADFRQRRFCETHLEDVAYAAMRERWPGAVAVRHSYDRSRLTVFPTAADAAAADYSRVCGYVEVDGGEFSALWERQVTHG